MRTLKRTRGDAGDSAAGVRRKWLLLSAAIAAEVAATMALRAGVDEEVWSLAAVAGYVAAYVLLGLALRSGVPIGVAYGIWGAAGVACTAVLGVIFFREHLGLHAIAGMALIILGVVLVETGSRHSSDPTSP
jgi:small multidrug resistance pump